MMFFFEVWQIMHRVLKAIATMGDIGDVMTWANPEVVQAVGDARAKKLWNQKT